MLEIVLELVDWWEVELCVDHLEQNFKALVLLRDKVCPENYVGVDKREIYVSRVLLLEFGKRQKQVLTVLGKLTTLANQGIYAEDDIVLEIDLLWELSKLQNRL